MNLAASGIRSDELALKPGDVVVGPGNHEFIPGFNYERGSGMGDDVPISFGSDNSTSGSITDVRVSDWFTTFGVEMDREPPDPPENPKKCVGIDVGIPKYLHDTDGTTVESVDLSDERERLEREQRKLLWKQTGRTTTTSNGDEPRSVTPISDTSAVTSSTNWPGEALSRRCCLSSDYSSSAASSERAKRSRRLSDQLPKGFLE